MSNCRIIQFVILATLISSTHVFADQTDLIIGTWKNTNITKFTRHKTIEFRSDGSAVINNGSKPNQKWKFDGKTIIIGKRPKVYEPGRILNFRTVTSVTRKSLTININTGFGYWDEKFTRTSPLKTAKALAPVVTAEDNIVRTTPLVTDSTPAPPNVNTGISSKYKLSLNIGHSGPVQLIRFSPDGQRILSSSKDNSLILWSKDTGRQIRQFYGFSCVVTVNYLGAGRPSTGGNSAWRKKDIKVEGVPCESQSLEKFVAQGNTIDSFIEKRNIISTIAFSPDGKYIVSGGSDEHLTLYDANSGKVLISYNSEEAESPLGGIKYASFSPSSKLIVTAGDRRNGEIGIWNVRTTQLIKQINTNAGEFTYIGFIPNDEKLILSAENQLLEGPGILKLRNVSTGEAVRSYTGHSANITSVDISKDGKHIISGDKNGGLILWKTSNSEKIRSFKTGSNAISTLEFSPDDKQVLVSAGNNIQLLTLSSATTQFITREEKSPIVSFALSTDGKHAAVGLAKSNVLSLLDIASKKKVRSFKGVALPTGDVRYSPDEQLIEMHSNPPRYWNLATGREGYDSKIKKQITERNSKQKKQIFSPFVTNDTYSPDEKWEISTASVGGFYPDRFVLKDRKTGKRKCKLQHPASGQYDSVGGVKFSRNGNYIIGERKFRNNSRMRSMPRNFPDDRTVFIWDMKSCDVVVSFPQQERYRDLNIILDSPDGKYALVVDDKRNLVLYDIADSIMDTERAGYNWPPGGSRNLRAVHTFQGYKGSLSHVRFSKDSSRLLTGGQNVEITIWDVVSGNKLVSILPLDNGKDSIIYTPDNYYISTKHAFKALSISKGKESFSFEQFDLRLNRPDIVLPRLSASSADTPIIAAYNKAYKKRLKKMGFTEGMLDDNYHTPNIKITNENDIPTSTNENITTINIIAKDSLHELNRLNVWVNSVPLYGRKGLDLKANKSKSTQRNLAIPLSQGNNIIQISVVNKKAAESIKVEKHIILNKSFEKPDLHIVSIGASKYQDATMNLDYAAKDATDLISIFKNKTDLYNNVHIHKLINDNVTVSNIELIRSKLMSTKVEDRVILFYAGHGLLDKNMDYYLGTHDINFNDPSKSGLAYDKLEATIDGIPARYKVAFIDACHSGEIDKEEVQLATNIKVNKAIKFRGFKSRSNRQTIGLNNSFALVQELFTDLRKHSGTTVISSAGGAEFAFESEQWNNGVFSHCLFDGLRNNKIDINGDNKTMVSEIQGYLLQCVSSLTNNSQKPTSRVENLSNDFMFW